MGSTRLPGKMMIKIEGKPLIEWVFQGLSLSKRFNRIVLCTSTNSENDILEKTVSKLGYDVFRGDESDVLDRFYQAAKKYSPEIVIRVCADNPLVNGSIIDLAIDHLIQSNSDYTFNHIPRLGNEYPDGLGAEVFWMKTLDMVYQKALDSQSREHVTSYIWKHPEEFKIGVCQAPKNIRFPEVKLDIDTPADLAKISELLSILKNQKLDVSDPESVCHAFLKIKS